MELRFRVCLESENGKKKKKKKHSLTSNNIASTFPVPLSFVLYMVGAVMSHVPVITAGEVLILKLVNFQKFWHR